MAWFRREVKSNPIGAALFMPGGSDWARSVDPLAYIKEGYQQNVVVNRAIREVTGAVANLTLEVARDNDLIEDHETLALLKNPNPMSGYDGFMRQIFTDYLLHGEMAIVAVGGSKPGELWPLSPRHIKIKPGQGGMPSAYVHELNNIKTVFPVDRIDGSSDLFFMKSYNPLDYWRGQSPLMAAAIAADTHNAGMQWNYRLLKNSARPSGILKSPAEIGREAMGRLREFFKARFQGDGNAGEIPILEGGLEWQAVDTSPRDMDFINTQKETAKLIAAALGVPIPFIDNDASTFNNLEVAKERFYTDTVLPLFNEFLAQFSPWIMRRYDPRLELRVDLDQVQALEPQRQRKFDRMLKAKAAGVLTTDEVRAAIGYDTLGGAAAELDPIGAAIFSQRPEDLKSISQLAYGA